MRKGIWSAVLLVASIATGQDLSSFEPVLLPVYTARAVSGYLGATFTVSLRAISQRTQLWWPSTSSDGFAQFGAGYCNYPFLRDYEPGTGRIIFVEDPNAIQFSYVLHAIARDSGSVHSASLPVVRRDRFYSTSFWILGVPLGNDQARVKLRLFRIDESPGEVNVTIHFQGLGCVSNQGVMRSFRADVGQREGNDPSFPFVAVEDIYERCFVTSPHSGCQPWAAAFQIDPITPGLYWALVSVTNNSSQEVTLFYPQ